MSEMTATRSELQDVIAALRIAVEATDNWEKLGQVTRAILDAAPATPDDNTGGLELLLRLHRAGEIRFQVGDDDA